MSLKWRLTILTAVLIAVASALMGVATYVAAGRIQVDSIDRALTAALTDTRVRLLDSRLRPLAGDYYAEIGIGQVDPADSSVTVLRETGSSLEPVAFPSLTRTDIVAASDGPITVRGDPDYRVLVRQPRLKRNPLVAVASMTAVDEASHRLGSGILLSVLGVTVLGALASWLMVRRFFRPMDAIVESAQAISRGETDRRIPPTREGTEFGDLSMALNVMIGSLTESIAKVEGSEERLRRFVSDASHEIRTPLTVITGYVELLQRDASDLDDVHARALRRIDTESRRLERLVTQLLLLERLDAQLDARREPFDLGALVIETFTDDPVLGRDRPVDVAAVPTTITGDADAWRQLLGNLVQNINRYTPPDTPVTASLERRGNDVILCVDDAGPGIPATLRDAALGRFTRLDPSRSSSTGGFGLGLSIVRSVVEGAGGRLELLDSPMGGLRTQITIPDDRGQGGIGSLPAGP